MEWKRRRWVWMPTATLLAGALLAGCERQDPSAEAAARAKLDPAVIEQQAKMAEAAQRRGQLPQAAGSGDKSGDVQVAQASPDLNSTPATGATGSARASDRVNDATINAEVNAGLVADPKLSAMRISVDTKGGVVTLNGNAPDDQARIKATEIAATPKGVVRVENNLTVAERAPQK